MSLPSLPKFLIEFAHLFPVLLIWCRRFYRSQSLRGMVQYTPYTFLAIEQKLS